MSEYKIFSSFTLLLLCNKKVSIFVSGYITFFSIVKLSSRKYVTFRWPCGHLPSQETGYSPVIEMLLQSLPATLSCWRSTRRTQSRYVAVTELYRYQELSLLRGRQRHSGGHRHDGWTVHVVGHLVGTGGVVVVVQHDVGRRRQRGAFWWIHSWRRLLLLVGEGLVKDCGCRRAVMVMVVGRRLAAVQGRVAGQRTSVAVQGQHAAVTRVRICKQNKKQQQWISPLTARLTVLW